MDSSRQLHARRAIYLAVALALLGPLSAGARPSPASTGVAPTQAPASTAQTQDTSPGTQDAPTDLGTVVVTANKRSERLQAVPMAVSALSGSDLERQSALNFADYATRVPGLSTVSQGPGQTQLTLRGITSGANTANATVGTYIDDTPYGSSTVYSAGSVLTPDIDPDDVERIEVLRGPQGTLYGSNTLGGLVKFVTVKPDASAFAGRVQAGASSVSDGGDGFDAHAMVNLPLVRDTLALRVNAYTRHDPGYTDNVATGKKDVDDARVHGGRAQLLWTPNADVSLRLSALAQNLSGDALANTGTDVDPLTLRPIYGDLKQNRTPGAGAFAVRYRLYDAGIDANLGWSQLVSSTSYSTLDRDVNTDATVAYGPIINPALGLDNGGYSIRNPITLGKFTQELRLQSPADQTLEWRVGVFYTREHTSNVQDILTFDASTGEPIALPFTLGHIAVGPATFTEWAGYGDITWHASERFSVLLGARYTHDQTTYAQTGTGILVGDSDFTIKGSDSPTTFLISPSFTFSDDVMAYARVASGYRPGGPNVGVPPGLGAPETFAPDKLVSYELGVKSTLLDRHMTLDVAGFYIDWDKIQLTSFAGGFSFLGNGGKATSKGVEASWQYAAAPGLMLSANATWTDAQLAADTPEGLYGAKGDPLPWVPRWSANLGIDYDFPLGNGWSAFVGGSYRYVGKRVTDFQVVPGPRFDVPSYDGVDLRAGVNVARWTFKAYVKNLTNDRGISAMSSETTDPTGSPFSANYVTPRTVGLSASVSF
ncbi:TonB-dependent receptor [Dyella sp.]|jgi:outer membrane receptor protein involved in Fe transport|uniref:TonB-dependent receptor n=1 Tax=Dyella sp. TaxID=1869338 RepID=UPI002D769101|nr:TonB-dependent receptor [Dyella sp.]HET6430986.1 TonB-dependent receptor [Dyella sp.]